ncbi:MAG: hypothetical protein Q8Q09_04620 [Deltaproteobacteria bacterium]|nr:hypothetical protein [Deltaproteobacteria bacterium]
MPSSDANQTGDADQTGDANQTGDVAALDGQVEDSAANLDSAVRDSAVRDSASDDGSVPSDASSAGDSSGGSDGATSFCAMVRCAAGSYCCEEARACLPNATPCPPRVDGDAGADSGSRLCGRAVCTGREECCTTGGAMSCVPAGTCGADSFCSLVRCAAGNYCCESARACVADSVTCRDPASPAPFCRPACAGSETCCGVGDRATCITRGMVCASDPCLGVTCGSGFSCCGVGRNAGVCQPDACLSCCM